MKMNAWLLCMFYPVLNQAVGLYKSKYCEAGEGNLTQLFHIKHETFRNHACGGEGEEVSGFASPCKHCTFSPVYCLGYVLLAVRGHRAS
jgi:hypothetical protein